MQHWKGLCWLLCVLLCESGEGQAAHCGTWAELRNFTRVDGGSPLPFLGGDFGVVWGFFFLLPERLTKEPPFSVRAAMCSLGAGRAQD